MRKILARLALAATLPLLLGLLTPVPRADAAPATPAASALLTQRAYGCSAVALYVKKRADGYVEGKMRVNCPRVMQIMRVRVNLNRWAGGGAPGANWTSSEGKTCTNKSLCEYVFKSGAKDPAGKQKYRFMNYPGSQGTMVSRGLEGTDAYCYLPEDPDLWCTHADATF
ncbi:hypothetical protein [Pimelobacter simplex]|uniref:hypothetical protein n=1 Tax=Nocardioides simplex TaxID=2045 RepID=UPI00214FC20F|nr:hypothetical protein [Pimelobacter simplex]UUW90196.1 hypothetical protein M0M43_01555 [Pimelobacter simplex]UUW94025.1 hypothetical protein M0M48_20065 [Pimelobacter simplex]